MSCFFHGVGCDGIHNEWNRPDDEPEACATCSEVVDRDDRCGCDEAAPVKTIGQLATELRARRAVAA